MASNALKGLRAFAAAPPVPPREARPEAVRHGGATLRHCEGSGPLVVLVPSPINPPDILDLDGARSLASGLAASGARVLLLDWGRASDRRTLDLGQHVSMILEPLLERLSEPAALLGYCLGGTLALAAASRVPIRRVATLATPWRFDAYPEPARSGLSNLLDAAAPVARTLGVLPMEVLQSAFWSLDPVGVVAKFAAFAALDPASVEAREFVMLEEWANGGEPLPWPAAVELSTALFRDDRPARGEWRIDGRAVPALASVPSLHLVAARDRIVPPQSAPPGERWVLPTGHVGLAIGTAARQRYHPALFEWLRAD
jgi:polyhydroxyalkanoate synthase subunit PhaC